VPVSFGAVVLGQALWPQAEEHAEHRAQVEKGDRAADVGTGSAEPGQITAERQHDDQRTQGPGAATLGEPLGHLIGSPVDIVLGGGLLLGNFEPEVVELGGLLPQRDGMFRGRNFRCGDIGGRVAALVKLVLDPRQHHIGHIVNARVGASAETTSALAGAARHGAATRDAASRGAGGVAAGCGAAAAGLAGRGLARGGAGGGTTSACPAARGAGSRVARGRRGGAGPGSGSSEPAGLGARWRGWGARWRGWAAYGGRWRSAPRQVRLLSSPRDIIAVCHAVKLTPLVLRACVTASRCADRIVAIADWNGSALRGGGSGRIGRITR